MTRAELVELLNEAEVESNESIKIFVSETELSVLSVHRKNGTPVITVGIITELVK